MSVVFACQGVGLVLFLAGVLILSATTRDPGSVTPVRPPGLLTAVFAAAAGFIALPLLFPLMIGGIR